MMNSADCSFTVADSYAAVCEIYASLGLTTGKTSPLTGNQRIFALGIGRPGGEPIGIVSGLYSGAKRSFEILTIYLKDGERTVGRVIAGMRGLLSGARERFHPVRYEWCYQLKDAQRDPQMLMARKLALPWLSPASRHEAGTVIRMRAAALQDPTLKHNHDFYSPGHIKSLGYDFRLWEECGEGIRGKIRTIVNSPEENAGGLSPFVGDDYDPHASIVLTFGETVCGWVICYGTGREAVEIRRWYIAKAFRRRHAGHFLGAYMLRVIQARYASVYFTVLKPSASMRRFARGYLGRAITAEAVLYRLEMADIDTV